MITSALFRGYTHSGSEKLQNFKKNILLNCFSFGGTNLFEIYVV